VLLVLDSDALVPTEVLSGSLKTEEKNFTQAPTGTSSGVKQEHLLFLFS
jgi:hypothetical protein